MKEGQTFVIDALPGVLPYYLKAMAPRPGIANGDNIPATRVEWPSFRFSEAAVRAYAKACSWHMADDQQVPLYFPHSFFGPLHLLMLTERNFPLRVLGGLHLRNHIVQHRALYPGTDYSANLLFCAERCTPQGLEVDFRTEIKAEGALHWESLTTFLFRTRCQSEDAPSKLARAAEPLVDPQTFASFPVPANTGKTFGRITRDINPIHMSRWLAKAFGFERDLCHGMWALARTQSEINGIDYQAPVRSDAVFKGPLYMGRDITLKADGDNVFHHELYSGDNDRPCVIARLMNVPADTTL